MSKKKYKRIGWVVEVRRGLDSKWLIEEATLTTGDKGDAINLFNPLRSEYEKLQLKNLARCVPVYVEVQDG